MKRARFLAGGTYHEGQWQDGVLVDAVGRPHDPAAVTWLPPVVPAKIIGLALNYADHAAELGLERPDEPALFLKPANTLVGHRAPVIYPTGVRHMHYENELAAVIGRRCRKVPAEHALAVVGGYTIANDLTVRDFVHPTRFRPAVKAKGFDTFCPLGPWVVQDEIADPTGLDLRTYVNGELRQQGNTRDLIYTIPALIEYISFFMTLEPGDIILTGTPKGVSAINPGDVMRLEIAGVGALENPVAAEPAG